MEKAPYKPNMAGAVAQHARAQNAGRYNKSALGPAIDATDALASLLLEHLPTADRRSDGGMLRRKLALLLDQK